MCRSTDYQNFVSREDRPRDRLNVRGIFVRLSGLRSGDPLPDSLTLVHLRTRPEPKALVALHRVASVGGAVVFGIRDRVRVADGAGFEVHVAGQRALRGRFRREGQDWNLECGCALEGEMVGVHVAECEVCVALDGHVALTERVGMLAAARSRRRRKGFVALETIPEERDEGRESDGCGGCTCSGRDWEWEKVEFDGDSNVDSMKTEVAEQGVGWAVDVGLWVVCLGVGYVVSKSSAKTLRRLKIL